MGGTIQVESNPGYGSKFSIVLTLPKSSKKFRKRVDLEKPSDAKLRKLKILVVEDDRVNQMVAKKMLSKFVSEVTIAANGLQAIDKFKMSHFDIIFMDIQMPEMDGFEATGIIRKQNQEVAIVAMTANATIDDQQQCLQVGMNDFISKPVKINTLKSILEKYA